MKELAHFGKFTSPMTTILLGYKKHCRETRPFIPQKSLHLSNNHEETLDLNCNSSYTIFATTERPKYFGCEDIGHKRLSCPCRAVQPGSSGGNSARFEQQQHGNLQQENAGESGLGANDLQSSDTLEPELKEVSDEHNSNNETNTAPSDNNQHLHQY